MKTTQRKGFFSHFFSSLNLIRLIFINLLFWGVVVFILFSILPRKVHVPEDALLYLKPLGTLVEKNDGASMPEWMEALTGPISETSAFRISRLIRMAGDDQRIRILVLDLSELQYASLAVLQEIESDIQYFRTQGKAVYAWADHYNLYSYYLASAADAVYMDPMGQVLLPGYSLYRSYYGNAMEKWNLEMAYFHAGEFKSYGDSYIASAMSDDMKKENQRWLDHLWSQYLERVGENRNLSRGALESWIKKYPDDIGKQGSSEALSALSSTILDGLLSFTDFDREMMKNLEGGDNSVLSWYEYDRLLDFTDAQPGEKTVAVITASGQIHQGESSPWSIGSDSLISHLDEIGNDSSVRALVLRLDTGGGSAYASELIRRKLIELKSRGVTILVSMGGVTASGGYWIATAADEIWTAPGTITGSIGVFTLIPQLAAFADETLGIRSDGVGTTWMSGQDRIDQPLNDQSRSLYQGTVDNTYNQFLTLVSESRNLPLKSLLPLAEGRIWSGEEALKNGLADHSGTMQQSITAAAALAGLEDYHIRYQRDENLNLRQYLMKMQQGNFSLSKYFTGIDISLPPIIPGRVYALSQIGNK
ncbi:signal peptide peptidase SppA [Oceanispirochaeta sp.]|jgi:protease-4|uniref:signal peptide peptidase SppA n=1 Tax=Oceanispirochaeta sp. TaxID=2035350 RepID=UPI002626D13B|nr:signal peptide peptidase SppA [Oceanispirochaeta sp.]MDA3956649.1 signal peptide peptidase SppA [Oceanispirochaeta sp.]